MYNQNQHAITSKLLNDQNSSNNHVNKAYKRKHRHFSQNEEGF